MIYSSSSIQEIIVCRRSGAFVKINNQMIWCPQKFIQALFQDNDSTAIIVESQVWFEKGTGRPVDKLVIAYIGVPVTV